MAKGHVFIREDQCKGCGLCVTACPQQVILINNERLNARGYHPAQYVDPEGKCTGCALCAVVCPDVCLTVYKFIPASSTAEPVVI
jgi:2-oxoglutarate ferredoxin oxidoreductase subunit delta